MERKSRGLGFRLITVSGAIVAVAALVVAVVVVKLSEDEVKTRLLSQADELATVVYEVAGSGADPQELARAVLSAKLRKAGSAWVLDREGRFVANPDPRQRKRVEQGEGFGDAEI
ncbi:MAG: hypothetical protein ACYDA8_07880, partial [Deferrisomatales bacterium]